MESFAKGLHHPPNSKVWGSLVEKEDAPSWMGGTPDDGGVPDGWHADGLGGWELGTDRWRDRSCGWHVDGAGEPSADRKRRSRQNCRARTRIAVAPHKQRRSPDRHSAGPQHKERRAPTQSAAPRHKERAPPRHKAPDLDTKSPDTRHTECRDVTKGVLGEDRRAPMPTLDSPDTRSGGPRRKERGERRKERRRAELRYRNSAGSTHTLTESAGAR